MGVTVQNAQRLTRKLNKIGTLDVRATLNKATTMVYAQAKELAPVDEGYLAGSIRGKVKKIKDGYQGIVYTNMEYASYVEFGTGIKGDGTYPYKIEGLNLTYKSEPWVYYSEKEEKFIFTTGQEAQPYMYPALKNNEKRIKKLFNEGVKTELNSICKGGK